MHFVGKYTTFYETISKTPDKKSINVMFKFFDAPVRRLLQLCTCALINNEQCILSQPFTLKKNKLIVTEKLFLILNTTKSHVITHLKQATIKIKKLSVSSIWLRCGRKYRKSNIRRLKKSKNLRIVANFKKLSIKKSKN